MAFSSLQRASLSVYAAWLLTCGTPDSRKITDLYPPAEATATQEVYLAKALADLGDSAPWMFDSTSNDPPTYVYWTELPDTVLGMTVMTETQVDVLLEVGLIRYSPIMLTLTHELGHAMGLSHSEDKNSIMYKELVSLVSVSAAARSLAAECVAQKMDCHGLRVVRGAPQ